MQSRILVRAPVKLAMYSTFWTKIGGGRGIIEFLGDVTVQSFSLVAKMLNLLLLLLFGVGGFLSLIQIRRIARALAILFVRGSKLKRVWRVYL